MKIAVAQVRSIKGDVQRNLACHAKLINMAVAQRANVIIFPELSLTGYEPTLAGALATDADDTRFSVLQGASDTNDITIGVGMPTRNPSGVCISVVLFQPHQPRRLYSKRYLHPDETAFFIGGGPDAGLIGEKHDIALAICYELSVPAHAATAVAAGAHFYLASVAKSNVGIAKAAKRLAQIARDYAMTVFVANSVGLADGFPCAGQSAVWNQEGALLAQLDGEAEGIIIHDTANQETVVMQLAEMGL